MNATTETLLYFIALPFIVAMLYYYLKKKLRQWIAKIAREEIEKMH
jgi:hypothetical protein